MMIQPEQSENGLQKVTIQHASRHPSVCTGYPWERIQTFLTNLALAKDGLQYEPVLDLVKAITASPYAPLLHAVTSLTNLLVYPYSPFDEGREKVTIAYLYDGNFLFTYQEVPGKQPVWQKKCSVDESKHVFEQLIIHKLRWVPLEFRRARATEFEQAGFPLALE